MGKKILLIEDNPAVRENTQEILELAGYEVVTAPDGKAGVELALQETPHLIICDIMMPVLDGYGVLHLIHKNPKTQATPFIFLTAKADRADQRKGMEMGADDFITKPFDNLELLNAIEARFKKQEMQPAAHTGSAAPGSTGNAPDAGFHIEGNDEKAAIKKKEILYTEGRHPHYLYKVLSGKIKVFKTNNDGKELITHIATAGDYLGYLALLEGTPYQETAEALEEAEVALLPKQDFFNLLDHDVSVSRKFVQLLARHVAEKEAKLLMLAYNSLRRRVANGLLEVAALYRQQPAQSKIGMAREDLAQVVGTATESLIRTLSDFRQEKLIAIVEGKIEILNEKGLKHVAET
ncbi:MAG: response regulator [Chitinophagales bacterium]